MPNYQLQFIVECDLPAQAHETLRLKLNELLRLDLKLERTEAAAGNWGEAASRQQVLYLADTWHTDSIELLVFNWLQRIEEVAIQWMIRKPVLEQGIYYFIGAAYPAYHSKILIEEVRSFRFIFVEKEE